MALNSLQWQLSVFATCHLSPCAMKSDVSSEEADGLHMLPPIEKCLGSMYRGRREPVFVSECSFGVALMGRGCGSLFSWGIRRELE